MTTHIVILVDGHVSYFAQFYEMSCAKGPCFRFAAAVLETSSQCL